MSGNIFWLASYPKSGNTWMRVLLTNYLRNADQPADINYLDNSLVASARQIFDENVGVEASDLTQDEIERYRPYVYERISAKASGPIFLKVHDAYTMTCEGRPMISTEATGGVVYLVRNPLDVSVSFAHHCALSIDETVQRMGDPKFTFVDNPDRLHRQLRQRLLSWSGHVQSWMNQSEVPILVVSYEDMITDTISTFTKVVQFCGLEEDASRIAKAVEFSTFEGLQSQERKSGFGEKLPEAKSFFRKGIKDSWTHELNTELVERIVTDHAVTMTDLNYPTVGLVDELQNPTSHLMDSTVKNMAPTITLDTRMTARSDLLASSLSETESVMMDIDKGKYYGVEDVAKFIWDYLSVTRSVSEVCMQVSSRFDISTIEAEKDTIEFLSQLVTEGLVQLDGTPSDT